MHGVETVMETGTILVASTGIIGATVVASHHAHRQHHKKKSAKIHPEGEKLTEEELLEEKLEDELEISDIEEEEIDEDDDDIEKQTQIRNESHPRRNSQKRRGSSIVLNRVRSLGAVIMNAEEEHPKMMLCFATSNAVLGLLFYFLDVTSDGNLAASLYRNNMIFEFVYMAFFMTYVVKYFIPP